MRILSTPRLPSLQMVQGCQHMRPRIQWYFTGIFEVRRAQKCYATTDLHYHCSLSMYEQLQPGLSNLSDHVRGRALLSLVTTRDSTVKTSCYPHNRPKVSAHHWATEMKFDLPLPDSEARLALGVNMAPASGFRLQNARSPT